MMMFGKQIDENPSKNCTKHIYASMHKIEFVEDHAYEDKSIAQHKICLDE